MRSIKSIGMTQLTQVRNYRTWALYEDGYIHTSGLTKEEAEEMHERYNRILGEKSEYIIQDMGETDIADY